MGQITSLTRRDIFDLLTQGYTTLDPDPFGKTLIKECRHTINIFGRLSATDFLSRLYPLREMPSLDSRYKDACDEIKARDSDANWLLTDTRFHLKDGTDKELLDFLCEIFHPEVRDENSRWRDFLGKTDDLIKADGYEFYIDHAISGHNVYKWRPDKDKYHRITEEETRDFCALFNNGTDLIDFYKVTDFDDFAYKQTGIHVCSICGGSKHKSLAAFTEKGREEDVIKLLLALFARYEAVTESDGRKPDELYGRCKAVAARLAAKPAHVEKCAGELKEAFSSEYMTRQIDEMLKLRDTNPTDAAARQARRGLQRDTRRVPVGNIPVASQHPHIHKHTLSTSRHVRHVDNPTVWTCGQPHSVDMWTCGRGLRVCRRCRRRRRRLSGRACSRRTRDRRRRSAP